MSKYKSELVIYSLNRFYKMKSKGEKKSVKEIKNNLKSNIITWLYNSGEIQHKIKGMCYRNNIPIDSKIGEDVIQESFIQLYNYNIDDLFLAYCNSPSRIVAIMTTITSRTGFRKMNDNVSPNQSVAKKILYGSNFQGNGEHLGNQLVELPVYLDDDLDLWDVIKSKLSFEDNEFLEFVLTKVYSKNVPSFGRDLKKKSNISLNEFKIKLRILQNRIRIIVDEEVKNKLNNE